MRRIAAITMLAAAASFVHGCSPGITSWSDRGIEGLAAEDRNLVAFHDTAAGLIGEQEQIVAQAPLLDIQARKADAQEIVDVLLAAQADGGKITPETISAVKALQGAEAADRARHMSESIQLLTGNLAALQAKRNKLGEMLRDARENTARTRACFVRVKSLNRAWTGANAEMAVQIARLADQVAQMRSESKGK